MIDLGKATLGRSNGRFLPQNPDSHGGPAIAQRLTLAEREFLQAAGESEEDEGGDWCSDEPASQYVLSRAERGTRIRRDISRRLGPVGSESPPGVLAAVPVGKTLSFAWMWERAALLVTNQVAGRLRREIAEQPAQTGLLADD